MTSPHDRNHAPDWDALARYHAGESSAEESAAVAGWLAGHPVDATLLEALESTFATLVGDAAMLARGVDVEAALRRVHERLDASESAPPALRVVRGGAAPSWRTGRRAIGGLLAAAAVVALAVALGRERASRHATTGDGVVTFATMNEYHTSVGRRDSVLLSDGTRVFLAPDSRLMVASSYGRAARDVIISGMARFAVRHDAALPFAVHAGSAVIRDVGTEFIVRAPDAGPSSTVSVAVLAGEVTFGRARAASAPTSLRAGDRAVLLDSGGVLAERGAVGPDEAAWTRGVLAYHAASMDVVRDDLRRWYGIDLELGDSSLASRRLTTTFDNQAADQVLRTIALALGATVQRAGDVATLRSAAIGR